MSRILHVSGLVLLTLLLGMHTVNAGTTGETVTLYMTDAQGNVVMEKDGSGDIIARFTYRPYGIQQSGPTNAGPGYTGHVNDPATGLVYMQQRYYDPAIGRFISPDPVALATGNVFNFGRYTYADDNPIVNIDPDGRETGRTLQAEWRMMGAKPNLTPDPVGKAIAAANLTLIAGPVAYLIAPEATVAAVRLIVRKGISRATRADTKHSIPKNREQHIFRDEKGHMKDTPQNREILQRVADNPKTTLGKDKYGNTWSSHQNKDGSQTWTQTRNDEIINGGINQTPRQYNPETGLSRPARLDKEIR